jgi:hypothetical protein
VREDQPQYTIGIDPDPDSDPDTDGTRSRRIANNRLKAVAKPRLNQTGFDRVSGRSSPLARAALMTANLLNYIHNH